MKLNAPAILLLTSLLLAPALGVAAQSVRISADKDTVGMGQSITLTTQVTTASRATRGGHRIIPFVNGARWGAIEVTDAGGKTVHHLPLPNPGGARVQVLVQEPRASGDRAQWIWGPTAPESAGILLPAGLRLRRRPRRGTPLRRRR